MFLQITFFSIFISYSMSSKIGNYSQNITDYNKCGVSRNTFQINDKCFKNRYDFNPNLRDTRNAGKGEAPWVAYIHGVNYQKNSIYCGGTIISNQWVITAAHCLIYQHYWIYVDMRLEEGEAFKVSKVIQHPKWIKKNAQGSTDKNDYDIGMLKLEKALVMDNRTDYQSRGTICLPSKDFVVTGKKQLAKGAGWGMKERDLKIGTYTVQRMGFSNELGHLYLNTMFRMKTCYGDSGSGIWMYERGRAFLVGITSTFYSEINCSTTANSPFMAYHINWIIETIQK